jgi:Leucine-rich repeat (LRR) protein
MGMSKIFYLVLIFCSFSIAGFGQYFDDEITFHPSILQQINKSEYNEIFSNPNAERIRFLYYDDGENLPDTIPYLPMIKELVIQSSDISHIPDWSDSLPNVEKIKIQSLKFSGVKNHSIEPGKQLFNTIKNYRKLTKLDIGASQFINTLEGINELKNLEYLRVGYCGLTGISEDVIELKELKYLEIGEMRELSKEHFRVLSKIENLEIFDYYCSDTLSNEGIYLLQQIHTLSLGRDIEDISKLDINRFPNLRNLEFYIKRAEDIPESFTNAKYVRYIRIFYDMYDLLTGDYSREIEERKRKAYEKLENIDATIEIIPFFH